MPAHARGAKLKMTEWVEELAKGFEKLVGRYRASEESDLAR
jgi:hypothetical protein